MGVVHGTNVAYVVHECRCDECRQANREYERARVRRKMYGTLLFVPAEPVRERWLQLRASGMNDNEIERVAGVSHHTSQNLFRGHQRTGKPVQRIKRETAERIMSVDRRDPRPGYHVSTRKVREMCIDLMALGYSRSWIARQIGQSVSNFGVFDRANVRLSTAVAIKRLWESTVEPAPEDTHHQRSAAARSRNFANEWRSRYHRRAS